MKNLLSNLFERLSKAGANTEMKEPVGLAPVFTNAELWNIQRQARLRGGRRFL